MPWKGYFDIINKCDLFVIYDEVQYTKNDWRNRNYINTKNGLQWLTVPVKHKSLDQSIDSIQIINNNWRKKHIRSIKQNYSKTLFLDYYFERLKKIIIDENSNLSDLNIKIIKEICSIIGINTEIISSKELKLEGDKNEKIIDACNKTNSNIYISGPSAKNYINESLFQENQIEIKWMNYKTYPSYIQQNPKFFHNVSILDLIFNLGKETINYISSDYEL
jgi:hypothetical protein